MARFLHKFLIRFTKRFDPPPYFDTGVAEEATACKKSFFPTIFLVSVEKWAAEPLPEWDEQLKAEYKKMRECLAWFYPYSNIVFFRDDCFTFRILFHELGHWFIFTMFKGFMFHNAVQAWWDKRCFFVFHMALKALKVGVMTKEDLPV